MLYTEKEKHEIERVKEVFAEHLRQSPDFELLWSDKVGYVWLTIGVNPVYVDTGIRIESAADLCGKCLDDVANKPRDKVSQGGVRQQASIPVVLACCVSPPNSGRRSINLRRRFTVKLTTQELEQMKSVDIGAVAAESLPDVSGMTFDNALSRKERISRFLQTVKNPYCLCIGGVGVKIEFAESGPSLQDKLTDFLLRQRSGL